MLLSSLGTSIANVGLPTLAQAFSASFQQVQWVVLAYLLAITTLVVSAGRLGDIIGRRRLLLAGIVLFTLASVLCGARAHAPAADCRPGGAGPGCGRHDGSYHGVCRRDGSEGKTAAPWGCSARCPRLAPRSAPSLGGVLIAGFGWPAHLLHQRAAGHPGAAARASLPACRPSCADGGSGRFRRSGTLLLALTLGGLCTRHDDRARQFRPAQHGAAVGCGVGAGLFVLAETQRRITVDPLGDVPRSGAERGLRDERPGHDRGDGDAGGRPVLSVRRARARRSPCRTRHVVPARWSPR